jgi:ribonuclease HI
MYTDGAILLDQSASGLAAIVYDRKGRILHWWGVKVGGMTCNQAEYYAVIMGLERLIKTGACHVAVYSDSQILVHQMSGSATARSAGLRLAQAQLRSIAARHLSVSFHHIPREMNRLADALANQALIDWDPAQKEAARG